MLREIEGRLALVAFLALAAGMAASFAAINAVFLALGALLRTRSSLTVFGIAAITGYLIGPQMPANDLAAPSFFRGQVTILSPPEVTKSGRRALVRAGGASYYLTTSRTDLALGDRLEVFGEVLPATSRGRPGLAGATIKPLRLEIIQRGSLVAAIASRWRESFLALCDATMSQRAAVAVGALCFNAAKRLDEPTRDRLQSSGAMHIISVSGLHVVIFAFGLSGLLSVFPIPRAVNLAVLLIVLALYALATGLQPPVVRAVIMTAVISGAYLLRRQPDLLSALALSGLVYLVADPPSLLDPGFQLSFATVAGFAIWLQNSDVRDTRWLEQKDSARARIWHMAKTLAAASMVASLVSAPLVAYYFGQIPLLSVLTNLLIAPAIAPLTLTALAALPLFQVAPAVSAGLMRVVVEPLAGWVLAVVDTIGGLSVSSVSVPPFSGYWLIPVYAIALAAWRKRARQP